MFAVIETQTFIKQSSKIWSDDEHDEFIDYLAQHPDCGDVIRGSDGLRKVRWSRLGSGKSGGVRVIYIKFDDEGNLVLLTLYTKSHKEDLSHHEIRRLKNER